MKKEKREGITIVALIITVVVLIMIAGIGIIAITGQEGPIQKAKEAKIKTEKREIWQKINLIVVSVRNGNNAINSTTLKDKLQTLPGKKEIIEEENIIVKYPDYQFIIDLTTGKVLDGTKGEKPSTIVPIPAGFVISSLETENTIENGLVIYEGLEPVTEEKHEQALTTRNQYVWIPVEDVNSMVMCQIHGDAEILDTITLQCPICKENTKIAGKLYAAGATGNNFNENLIGQIYKINDKVREPDLITNHDLDDTSSGKNYMELAGIASKKANDLLKQMNEDIIQLAKNVSEKGGFYVSRYEVSYEGTKINSVKGVMPMTAEEKSGNTWYGMYYKLRQGENRSMIWGCTYDQVMKFINKKKDATGEDYIVTEGSSTRHKGGKTLACGSNEADKVGNIYDLEGNIFEWTMEAYYTGSRINRAGYYYGKNSASNRAFGYTYEKYNNYTSRQIIY